MQKLWSMTAKSTKHLSAKQRINLVLNYYRLRGANSERVNKVYRNIINLKKQTNDT